VSRPRTKVRVGDLIEVQCIGFGHGWNCGCAPGPWRLTRLADKDGWIQAEHVTKRLSDGTAPSLGAHIDSVRIAAN